jgi:hypothetical protein
LKGKIALTTGLNLLTLSALNRSVGDYSGVDDSRVAQRPVA